jgi:hypothetical protein
MDRSLWLGARPFFLGVVKHYVTRGVACRSLPSRMQGFEKCNEGRRLCRTQVFPVRGHVPAPLDNLADELVLRQAHRNGVQRGTSLPARLPKGMAVTALLNLENERALPLKRRCTVQKSLGHGITAPSIHVRTPGRISSEVSECSQGYGDQQNRQNSDRPPAPTLFPFSRKKWEQNKKRDNDYGANEESWRLH